MFVYEYSKMRGSSKLWALKSRPDKLLRSLATIKAVSQPEEDLQQTIFDLRIENRRLIDTIDVLQEENFLLLQWKIKNMGPVYPEH